MGREGIITQSVMIAERSRDFAIYGETEIAYSAGERLTAIISKLSSR